MLEFGSATAVSDGNWLERVRSGDKRWEAIIDDRIIRVAIVDDHPIFRAGLRKLLESEPEVRVVGEGSDGTQVPQIVQSSNPDVLLLDFSMPGATGLDGLRLLKSQRHPVRPVILTAEINRRASLDALRLGAVGILSKTAATEFLFGCIRAVMDGQYWIDRETVADLAGALRLLESSGPTPDVASIKVSSTERRVLEALQRGASNKVIARELGIAEQTVKNHLSHLYDRFQATNRLDLVLKVTELGMHFGRPPE